MEKIPENFESHELKVDIKQNIIAAIEARDKEALFRALAMASNFLTGNWFGGKMEDIIRVHDIDVDNFFNELEQKGNVLKSLLIYLGDGGISRLVIRAENNQVTVEPSPVSSDKVKKIWEELT